MMEWIKNISAGMNVLTIVFGAVTGVVAVFVALNRMRKWCGRLRKEKDPSKQEQRSTVTEQQRSTLSEKRKKMSRKEIEVSEYQARIHIEWLEKQLHNVDRAGKQNEELVKENRHLRIGLDAARAGYHKQYDRTKEMTQERDKLQAHLEDVYKTIGQAYEQSDLPIDRAPTPREVEKAVRCLTKGAKKPSVPCPESKPTPIPVRTGIERLTDGVARFSKALEGLPNIEEVNTRLEAMATGHAPRNSHFPIDVQVTFVKRTTPPNTKGLVVRSNVKPSEFACTYITPSGSVRPFRDRAEVIGYMNTVKTACSQEHVYFQLESPTPMDYLEALNRCIDRGLSIDAIGDNPL